MLDFVVDVGKVETISDIVFIEFAKVLISFAP
jgi:hypothetical protein